ncbi:MAG: cyclase family protein, partial [Myxococcaceae bacterium]|nr:cyclase family protein [Myxococcaceae bacterium]
MSQHGSNTPLAQRPDKRVRFDFEVEFTNGGGLQGQDFRLDIPGDDIADAELTDFIVVDLRLLMVGRVRILNKVVFEEPHKRAAPQSGAAAPTPQASGVVHRFVDLSHTIEAGMVTLQGLPAPVICDFLSREASRARYAEGTEFHIGRIDMVANTGTYLDSPFHRFAGGADVSGLSLDSLADLEGVVVRVAGQEGRAVTRPLLLGALVGVDVRGKAVLVHTGWDAHWRTDRYFDGHPYLTADAAELLVQAGAALVGIDSLNIDDTTDGKRPVHTALLGAGIPIVEHLRGLAQLPLVGFRFSAVPVK